MEAPYLRITPGHYANIGKKDTLFEDREPSKTIPYSAARTYIAHIGEYPPPWDLTVPIDTPGLESGTVRIKCLAQDHNTMSLARAHTRTAWSRVECTNHEAASNHIFHYGMPK